MGQPQLSIQLAEQPAVGSSGARPSAKQQLESIKSWPRPGPSVAPDLGGRPGSPAPRPSFARLGWPLRDGPWLGRTFLGASTRAGAPAGVPLHRAGPRRTEGAGCPPHMCAGQMRWHLRRGQRACRSHYPGPLGKQLEKKHLAIWTGVRLQNGSFLCDSLPRTDEREGL